MSEKKLCMKCNIYKDLEWFTKHTVRKDGLSYICKECLFHKRNRFKDKIYVRSKVCKECNIEKERHHFPVHRNNIDFLGEVCLQCKENKIEYRSNHLVVKNKKYLDIISAFVNKIERNQRMISLEELFIELIDIEQKVPFVYVHSTKCGKELQNMYNILYDICKDNNLLDK
jgi:hypothetical protein